MSARKHKSISRSSSPISSLSIAIVLGLIGTFSATWTAYANPPSSKDLLREMQLLDEIGPQETVYTENTATDSRSIRVDDETVAWGFAVVAPDPIKLFGKPALRFQVLVTVRSESDTWTTIDRRVTVHLRNSKSGTVSDKSNLMDDEGVRGMREFHSLGHVWTPVGEKRLVAVAMHDEYTDLIWFGLILGDKTTRYESKLFNRTIIGHNETKNSDVVGPGESGEYWDKKRRRDGEFDGDSHTLTKRTVSKTKKKPIHEVEPQFTMWLQCELAAPGAQVPIEHSGIWDPIITGQDPNASPALPSNDTGGTPPKTTTDAPNKQPQGAFFLPPRGTSR